MTCPRSRGEGWPPGRSTRLSCSCPGSARPCGKMCCIRAGKTRHSHTDHVPIPVTSRRAEPMDGPGRISTPRQKRVLLSSHRWGLVPPNTFPELEGFADALPRLGRRSPSQ